MIKIYRKNNKIDELISYDILIDGNEIKKINNDESIILRLRSDDYSIQIISNRFKSNIIKFNVNDSENLVFICYPNHGNSVISSFFHRFIFKDGIKLVIENS